MALPGQVKIIIPAHRASATIVDSVAAALRASPELQPELIVVDDGDNPGLAKAIDTYPVTLRSTGGAGSAAVARNLGAAGFTDGILVFVDADVMLDPGALQALIAPIRDGRAHACVGNYSQDVKGLSFAAAYKQLYTSRVYERRDGYLRNDFWTAVGAVDAATFHALGGFDPAFRGANGEDAELGVRLTGAGKRILGVPTATARHRHAFTLTGVFVNDWRKARMALDSRALANGRLADNKHAGPRDVLAVCLAVAAAVTAPAALLGSPSAFAALLVTYLFARWDFLQRFMGEGVGFAMRATGLMFALDLLRCAIVLTWTTGAAVRHFASLFPPRRPVLTRPDHA